MPLVNIERGFVTSLLQQQENDAGFLSELLPLNSISKEMQLSIYRSNVNGAHQKVLAQVYPACFNILGEDYFNQLCRLYRFEYPSTNADLNDYGKFFPLFVGEKIQEYQELNSLEYLAELAGLEWHWHMSYYAKDDEVFSFEKLALIDVKLQDKIFFKVSNSFSLHSTKYPLLEIWEENKAVIESDQEFTMPGLESYFCIFRKDFTPTMNILNYEQHMLLKLISDGMTLAKLVELASDFENKLMCYIENNWVTGFSIQK